ncbi:MAG: nuclear transport factor 2 family protein [Deltaproteobacteria bacterium]|nr:nuclear transport factor 2 family protein [Deltaproteobacteria bacterium]
MSTEREDERELRKLAYRYARMIDRRDWDLIPQVFSEDARLSGPGYEMKGHQGLREGLKQIEMYSSTMHCVHNQTSQLEASDGTGELYCVANHLYEKQGIPFKLDMGIRYEDHYVRGPEGWRIADRVLNLIWQQDLPLEMGAARVAET